MPNASEIQKFDSLLAQDGTQPWASLAPQFMTLWQASQADLKFGLMAGAGLLHTGRESEAVALLSYLADRGHIIRTAQYNAAVNPKLREASRLADLAIRKSFTDLQSTAISSCIAPGRIESAVWPQTHNGPPPFPPSKTPPDVSLPRPYVFYAPELPHIAVFDDVDWGQKLAQHIGDIRAEFLSLMASDHNAGEPYVAAESAFGPDWAALKGQKNWNAVHLFKGGKEQPAARACPISCAAINSVPITRQNDVPIEMFFSVLTPGTTIPRHYGLANSRVTVHLPLIIPSHEPDICGIRVGSTTKSWNFEEPFVFDDSFDHSAWNLSDQTRVVLIFEAWRPDMTEGEISAVKASYETHETYLKERGDIVSRLAAQRA